MSKSNSSPIPKNNLLKASRVNSIPFKSESSVAPLMIIINPVIEHTKTVSNKGPKEATSPS